MKTQSNGYLSVSKLVIAFLISFTGLFVYIQWESYYLRQQDIAIITEEFQEATDKTRQYRKEQERKRRKREHAAKQQELAHRLVKALEEEMTLEEYEMFYRAFLYVQFDAHSEQLLQVESIAFIGRQSFVDSCTKHMMTIRKKGYRPRIIPALRMNKNEYVTFVLLFMEQNPALYERVQDRLESQESEMRSVSVGMVRYE